MSDVAILSQGVGYGVTLGIGFFFAALMLLLTSIQNRYTTHRTSSIAEFASASHSVKPGMIATAIVSSLLTSTAQGYKNGIVGPYSYACGAAVQIVVFACNAAKIKLNAPKAHTFLEVLRVRWGTRAHIVFMCYAFVTCLLVSAMLITGGSAVVTDLTGASTPAICILIPIGVIVYVLLGGLRASLLADYLHTAVLFGIILAFMFYVYTGGSDKIGSPSVMYDLLVRAAEDWPVEGNKDGSYLTFQSKSGMIFLVINLIGNFGTVFNDQAYWQRAIASVPSTAVKGYLLGGSAWLSVPLGMATTMGLSAVVLKYDPEYPGYPLGLTDAQVGAGLPAAAAAQTLLKETGAALLLVLLFMAVTSAASAELCAVSSIFSYDIWVPYIRPHASEREVLFVDRCAIVAWGLFSGVIGIAFYYAGISMGWLYESMGIFIGAGVIPIAMGVMWGRANGRVCTAAALCGTSSGIIGWLVATKCLYGSVTLETTFNDYPMLTGNVLSFCISGLIAFFGSLVWPEHYDWVETRALHQTSETSEEVDNVPTPATPDATAQKEKEGLASPEAGRSVAPSLAEDVVPKVKEDSPEEIRKTLRFATIVAIATFIIFIILIPLPMCGIGYISTKVGFTFYVVVAFIWVFWGAFVCVCLPLIEEREAIARICGHIWADLRGKGPKRAAAVTQGY
ncbi:urea transporter [Rhodotorula diobovata]|uniref:Urea transporter n=1 Tax=Rhodotorula diobovata TaxID=5288 RepID=A0A5C5G843_9BASI|nr:urea transporter [Rhodotorula diobovata]